MIGVVIALLNELGRLKRGSSCEVIAPPGRDPVFGMTAQQD
jgi:hypothetical protein